MSVSPLVEPMAHTGSSTSHMPYKLYHDYYSICALMVRYTFAVRGIPKDRASQMEIEEVELDLGTRRQMEEDFLCDINPKGQVPVLVNPGVLSIPITESIDISYYICARYPSLLPVEHKDQITKLLHDLHEVNYFSLSFYQGPPVARWTEAYVQRLLATPGLSARYIEALKYKLKVNQTQKIDALIPETVEKEVAKAKTFLSEIDAILALRPLDKETSWLFGGSDPTVLDAHLAVFLMRLRDINRENLIPERLSRFADAAMATDEWRSVMGSRKTMMSKGQGT